jgi:hypothetical protein
MSVKYDKDFFMFKNKTFMNGQRLNDAGHGFYNLLADILSDSENKSFFYNNVTEIVVTSQDRTKRNSNHSGGKAIDLTVYPLALNVWLFNELREYANTVYLSSFNRHIHFDLREEGLEGIEVLRKNGQNFFPTASIDAADFEIAIIPITPIINNVLIWYEVYKKPSLMASLYISLNNPIRSAKKLGQKLNAEGKEFYNDTIKPGIDKFLWIGGGILAFLLLKDSGGKTIVIQKDR